MKIIILLALTLLPSLSALASITGAINLGCGEADAVYDSLRKNLGEGTAVAKEFFPGLQGERFRGLYIYADGSWVLTFEYWNHRIPDLTCLMAMGLDKPAEAGTLVFRQFPATDIGPVFDRSALPALRY